MLLSDQAISYSTLFSVNCKWVFAVAICSAISRTKCNCECVSSYCLHVFYLSIHFNMNWTMVWGPLLIAEVFSLSTSVSIRESRFMGKTYESRLGELGNIQSFKLDHLSILPIGKLSYSSHFLLSGQAIKEFIWWVYMPICLCRLSWSVSNAVVCCPILCYLV
jgi:hypothetical protein